MKKIAATVSIFLISCQIWCVEKETSWDCELLNSILNSNTSYETMRMWMEVMEDKELDEKDFDRGGSAGPGLYRLVNTDCFDWKQLQVEPFNAEIRILGRNPSKPTGYFIKLHRMYGFALVYGDMGSVWIDTDFVCGKRGRIYGYNMPESVMQGPKR